MMIKIFLMLTFFYSCNIRNSQISNKTNLNSKCDSINKIQLLLNDLFSINGIYVSIGEKLDKVYIVADEFIPTGLDFENAFGMKLFSCNVDSIPENAIYMIGIKDLNINSDTSIVKLSTTFSIKKYPASTNYIEFSFIQVSCKWRYKIVGNVEY